MSEKYRTRKIRIDIEVTGAVVQTRIFSDPAIMKIVNEDSFLFPLGIMVELVRKLMPDTQDHLIKCGSSYATNAHIETRRAHKSKVCRCRLNERTAPPAYLGAPPHKEREKQL